MKSSSPSPQQTDHAETRSDWGKLTTLVLVMTVLHCIAAVSAPLLAGEAYYWLWGKHLAAGYFDHPPMVGVMSAIFFGWINGSSLVARSSAIFLTALSSFAVYALARELFPEGKTAWRAALLYTITPIFDVGGVMIMPDNSLVLFSILTFLFFWRAAQRRTQLLWWAASGIMAGLALLSKFHAWVLLPPLYLFLILSPSHRALLRSTGPWLALLIALAVLSPNLIWNANRGWMNYAFQWQRSSLPRAKFHIEYPLQYIFMPLLSLSPIVYGVVLAASWKALRRWNDAAAAPYLFLLCAGLPLPLFLGALSFGVQISVHWPSAGYVALIILAVAMIERGEIFKAETYKWMMISAASLSLLAHVAPYFIWAVPGQISYPFSPDKINTGRLKREFVGWPELGERVQQVYDEMNAEHTTVIMAKNWHLTSMLAFYSERPTEAFALVKEDAHNYELWRAERGGLVGCNAVVVIRKDNLDYPHRTLVEKYDKYHRLLDPLFESVKEDPSLIYYADGKSELYDGLDLTRPRIREHMIFRCYGFKGKLIED